MAQIRERARSFIDDWKDIKAKEFEQQKLSVQCATNILLQRLLESQGKDPNVTPEQIEEYLASLRKEAAQ